MGVNLLYFISVIVAVSAQTYKVCIPTSQPVLCQSLDKDGSQAVCVPVESQIECAIKLSRGEADLGVFSEEEMVLLGQHQAAASMRVLGSIRDVSRNEPYAFEAVAIVPSTHTGGLEGLRGGEYCHPGFDVPDLRWSPRVLKALEKAAARTDHCPDATTDDKTAEELEVETLSKFFSSACRPGPWGTNSTHDADLKGRYQSLCSLCGGAGCSYTNDYMGITVVGVNNNNRHIQALECMRRSTKNAVAYVAWQHVREFFNIRNPQHTASYSVLCEDGSLQQLTPENLAQLTAPCSFVKQPWSALVGAQANAPALLQNLKTWWPNGVSPGYSTWQAVVFSALIGGVNAKVHFNDALPTPNDYTSLARNITTIDASPNCLPARRWCTISQQEHTKCTWLQLSAHTLGIEPEISCQQRKSIFECFTDIKENTADFIAAPANYGYLARQHYGLSSVKLVQNSRSDSRAFSRVVALLLDSNTAEITRFENLREKKACFPEFGGISFVSFIRAAHEREVISQSQCDYPRAVGEFFAGACAPGALDASHALDSSNYDATSLCSVCKPANSSVATTDGSICSYDSTNKYYGNAGALACLADGAGHVAFVELEDIDQNLAALSLDPTRVRVLCRNNTLALSAGVTVDSTCLLADVVDSEVLSRRRDPLLKSLSVLLDTLDYHFGYNAVPATQLINMAIYSPFDGVNDLLFKNTAVGLSEPSTDTANEAARNYNELFQHLDTCTSSAPGVARSTLSFLLMALVARFVVY